PFNPVTRIEFALPEAGLASLKVFNIMGQQVATLVNQQLSAGRHTVRWDATNDAGLKVASGMYVYQLEVNGFTQSHKMLLLK
ncbi:MAG: FlgD immunoglobulin-like domain containing protein, partial [Thermodesulfobacteriota bacterium]